MIAYIATTALLAAGSASAGDTISFPFRTLLQSASGSASSDNQGGHYTHTSKPQYEKSHYTKRSSITCTAKASTKGWSKAKDAHAEAVAKAIKWGCSNDIDEYWAKDIEAIFRDDYGFAVAEVWASAKADCEGTGNVYGCAAAWASASRWATFTASAYADAWADAFNYCKCNKKDQLEGAYAYGTAYEMEELTAVVSAVADADVCIEGDGSASAHVESHCLNAIYANVWAKAIAKAIIKGECWTKLKAKVFTKAEAVIDVWEYVDCASHASTHY